ncbi:uncharacterized protein LOC108241742 [Kryptolebias marmoratus]|uniref:uncharacterized protein LOC108241742 n=1 Tax=Kryptolebias marmoratus TaxID=37003 RepID=UPI000D530AB6|nr:uncharacterized protein LOC108241742 [Kryptolebias marmoratus]
MMGEHRTFLQVLLLLAAGIVYMSSLAFALSNTTEGSGLLTLENSTSIPSNGSQESCRGVNLQETTQSISAAVDTFVGELSCKKSRNESLPEDYFKEVEQNLKLIVESSLKVYLKLGTTEPGSNVLDMFGVLDSLSLGNYSDPTFVKLWFSVKMAPLLPYVSQSFLIQLGNLDFSCSSYQELVKLMTAEVEMSQTMERKLIYSSFIKVYLSRKDSADPGCNQNVNGSEEWLNKNIGSLFFFATYEELKNISRYFSEENRWIVLLPAENVTLLLDVHSVVENATFVKAVLTHLTQSGDMEQLRVFFRSLTEVTQQNNNTFITNEAVRDTILNLTLTALAPEFENFKPEDYELWFQGYLGPVIASLQPASLLVIPGNISCESYAAM